MRVKGVALSIIVILMITGCGAPATIPPAIPTVSTFKVSPTVELQPTAIIQLDPTITPEAPLQTSGPHFLYFREVDGEYQLVVMDADGKGRKVISLPEGFVDSLTNKQHGLDMRFVSPDGKWLAFYTGYAGEWGQEMQQGTFDLTLNLLDLTTGERQVVTPLLSKDYPNNFVQLSNSFDNSAPSSMWVQGAFLAGITSAIAWSPDGRYLAFAGQMEGLSSDLYIFDMSTRNIRRLTDGTEQLQWIRWSPDGKWILHGSQPWVGEGMEFRVYAVNMVDWQVHELPYGMVGNWITSDTFFEYDSQNGPGNYGLRLVDINTGKITKLWRGSFFSYEVDLSKRWVVVATLLPDVDPIGAEPDNDFIPGLYLIDLQTMKKTHVDYPTDEVLLQYEIVPVNPKSHLFFLEDYSLSHSFFLSESSEVTPLDLKDAKVSFSADLQYWTTVSNQKVQIFSSDNILLTSIPFTTGAAAQQFEINWCPDDSGFFLSIERKLYAVDISNGSIELVETNVNNTYGQIFMWINEK